MAISLVSDPNRILERHQNEYAAKFLEGTFPRTLATLIAAYVVDGKLMDRAGWQEYFGVDIGPEPQSITEALTFDSFYKFYHGASPVNSTKQVCQASLIPVVMPESVIGEDGIKVPYTLDLLGTLVERPKKGNPATLESNNIVSWQHGKDRGATYLGIQFEGVVARNMSWTKQVQYLVNLKATTKCPCEEEPELCLQVTILIIEYIVTGKRFCGDISGIEARPTFGCVKELVLKFEGIEHVVAGGFRGISHFPGSTELPQLKMDRAREEISEEIGVVVQCKLGLRPLKSN